MNEWFARPPQKLGPRAIKQPDFTFDQPQRWALRRGDAMLFLAELINGQVAITTDPELAKPFNSMDDALAFSQQPPMKDTRWILFGLSSDIAAWVLRSGSKYMTDDPLNLAPTRAQAKRFPTKEAAYKAAYSARNGCVWLPTPLYSFECNFEATDQWVADGNVVVTSKGEPVCSCTTEALARIIVDQHASAMQPPIGLAEALGVNHLNYWTICYSLGGCVVFVDDKARLTNVNNKMLDNLRAIVHVLPADRLKFSHTAIMGEAP